MDLLQRALDRVLLQDVELDRIEPRQRPKTPARHWSRAVLMERIAYLKEMARFGNGSEQETVRELPGHAARLLYLSRTADAELDLRCSNLFVVLHGAATLVTGGTIKNMHDAGPGKMQGDTLADGTAQQLKPGDVAHVPASVPFQLQLTGEQTLSCFVVRIEAPEESK